MRDKKIFKEFMAGLGLLFDKEIPSSLSAIYWRILEPFTDEECEKVFNKLITTCKYFPKPVDFLELLSGTNEDRSLSAWQDVMGALTQGCRLADQTINSTVKALGGWDSLERQTYNELKWTEKRFREHFNVVEKREEFDLLDYSENSTKRLQ